VRDEQRIHESIRVDHCVAGPRCSFKFAFCRSCNACFEQKINYDLRSLDPWIIRAPNGTKFIDLRNAPAFLEWIISDDFEPVREQVITIVRGYISEKFSRRQADTDVDTGAYSSSALSHSADTDVDAGVYSSSASPHPAGSKVNAGAYSSSALSRSADTDVDAGVYSSSASPHPAGSKVNAGAYSSSALSRSADTNFNAGVYSSSASPHPAVSKVNAGAYSSSALSRSADTDVNAGVYSSSASPHPAVSKVNAGRRPISDRPAAINAKKAIKTTALVKKPAPARSSLDSAAISESSSPWASTHLPRDDLPIDPPPQQSVSITSFDYVFPTF
jgi:hypothetical protein